MIKAVVFDLDDTLYPEMDYVRSGYSEVAKTIANKYGLTNAEDELFALFKSDKSNVFDRYLKDHGLSATAQNVNDLVDVYRNHTPNIKLFDDVKQTLVALRQKGLKLGIITDGRPSGQHKKIVALGLDTLIDEIIITDELGGEEYRKPNSVAFELMAKKLGIELNEMMYVGDNPQKDFAVKRELPIITVQIINVKSLYKDTAFLYDIASDIKVESICDILRAVCGAS